MARDENGTELSLMPGEGLDLFPLNSSANVLVIHNLVLSYGECILLQIPSDAGYRNIVVDCPGEVEKVINYMDTFGIDKIHYAVNTHPDTDHFLGMQELLTRKMFPPDANLTPEIWLTEYYYPELNPMYRNFWNFAGNDNQLGIDLRKFPAAFDKIDNPSFQIAFNKTIGGVPVPIELFVVAPILKYRDNFRKKSSDSHWGFYCIPPKRKDMHLVNNTSLVINVSYANRNVLLTGDIETDSWQETFAVTDQKPKSNHLDCDVLKVAHHGSIGGTPEELQNYMSPKYAVITRGPRGRTTTSFWNAIQRRLDLLGVQDVYTWTEIDPSPQSYIFTIQPMQKGTALTRILCYVLNDPEQYGFLRNPFGYFTRGYDAQGALFRRSNFPRIEEE